MFSNIGYIIFGIAFIIIVYFRHNFITTEIIKMYNNGDREPRGVKLDTGIFYALGATSIGEGFLSACYHVCPNIINFQFDTTFMYTMALLIFLKVYQFRHPKLTPSAFATFALLSVILVVEVLGYLYNSLIFFILFIAIHEIVMFIIFWSSWPKNHNLKDSIRLIWCHTCVDNSCECLHFRLGSLVIIANVTLDIYFGWERTPGVSSYILLIVVMNMFMYNVYYVTRKLYCYLIKKHVNEKIGWDTLLYGCLTVVCVAFSGKLDF